MTPQFTAVADHALLVTFGEHHSQEVHDAVVTLTKAIDASMPIGVIEVVPAIVNLLVSFDPVITDHKQLEATLRERIRSMIHVNATPSIQTVQVCYESPYSPDLGAVAQACGLEKEHVIAAHLSGNYQVLMYGFAPGYAYLGGVPESIQVPRKPAAIRDIPAGSVMIAGLQCLVTTLKMPTGWSIIGRSPTDILLPDPVQPFLFDVGDQVAFERIDKNTYEAMCKEKA